MQDAGRGAGAPAAMRFAQQDEQQAQHPTASNRISSTDSPCIVQTKALVSSVPGTLSLAQGIVHWGPPPQALHRAAAMVSDPAMNAYGPDEGLPLLRDALRDKVVRENGLKGYDIHVTSGANQAFANVVIALLDAGDRCVLFSPFYFNHRMALQMTGGGESIVYGPCDPHVFHPDMDWLQAELAGPTPPKMVVICNPCNPTGVLLSEGEVRRAADMCGAAGAWLVLDNTYEQFVYEGRSHHCAAGAHVINLFSFSKAYGMMGWRVGYIAFPADAGLYGSSGDLGEQLLKVQDTVPICAVQLSQHVALGALEAGAEWVAARVAALQPNRAALMDALSPLGTLGDGISGGEGAIYLWARLPAGCEDDAAVVEWLVRRHGVCLIPGSSCGSPGHVRVATANLDQDMCAQAAARLKAGLAELAAGGMGPVKEFLAAQRQPTAP